MKTRPPYFFCFTLLFLSLLSSAQNRSDTIFYDSTALPRQISKFDSKNVITEQATYYKSGKLLSRSYYKDGKLNGPVTGYYEVGKKEFEFNYLNDLSDGDQFGWYETGEVKTKGKCKADSCEELAYYITGELKSITRTFNGRKYYCEERCTNGQVTEKYNLDGKRNLYTKYTCNGKVAMVGYLLYENTFVGSFDQRYENGNIAVLGQYLDLGENTFFGSIPVGEWKFFAEDGRLTQTNNYDNDGKLIKTVKY